MIKFISQYILSPLQRAAVAVVLAGLWLYRNCLSPLKPPCCRFYPTCSEYARTAITRFGLLHGGWLSLRRLLRCHPFYFGSACDPVPEPRKRGYG